MSILDKIGIKHGTDKSSLVHDYLKKYEKYLPYKRYEKIKILEVGVLGGASVKTWKEYFYNSQIIGVDINPDCKQFQENNIEIEIGSQFDKSFLDTVGINHGPFDMIVDDGSHINEHVIFTFKELFKYLKSGGIYLVEDVCTSYWPEYGGSRNGEDTMVSYFKRTIDEVNFGGEYLEDVLNLHARKDDALMEQFRKKGYDVIGKDIESINFLNSIILITKR